MALSYGFALNDSEDSAQFSEAFNALIGDGICDYGSKFNLTLNGGFSVKLATGFVIANGRYLKSDEPYVLTLPPSSNYSDRYDGIVVKVDYAARKAGIEVLVNINTDNIQNLRTDTEYIVILYTIHIKRGATVIKETDVSDKRGDSALCGYIKRIDSISDDALHIYHFLQSGIDAEVDRIIGISDALIIKANEAIMEIDATIEARGGTSIGDIIISKLHPKPINAWLLCDGKNVPERYPKLSRLLKGILPDIALFDTRFQAYIYGGTPDISGDNTGPNVHLTVLTYSGDAEISAINGIEYDVENMSKNIDTAPNGTIIIKQIYSEG